ncbi:hypothetical protein A2U01_0066575, partial [Trifolium medium]|nr:hypothetical protein [Trifolium medium]
NFNPNGRGVQCPQPSGRRGPKGLNNAYAVTRVTKRELTVCGSCSMFIRVVVGG